MSRRKLVAAEEMLARLVRAGLVTPARITGSMLRAYVAEAPVEEVLADLAKDREDRF